MKKRLTSLMLALVMLLTLLPVQAFAVDPENPFRDVKQGDWCYDAVQYVRVNGFFNGTTRTTFSPNDTMTRGMFVAVLGRVAGVDTAQYQGRSAFSDVPADAYFAPYVAWASGHGITTGTGDGRFSPYAPINRQQMAAFFVRYFEAFGVDYTTGQEITTTPADIGSVSPYAREAVLKLWRRGLLNGDGVNFNPAGNATRAQTATVCWRLDRTVETWYKEPGVPSGRVKVDPATGLPYGQKPGKPAETKPSTGGSSGSGGSGGGGGGTTPSGSYSVKFYDGSRLIEAFNVKKGEPLGKVPSVGKSSKANYILEGYYTDSNFTTPFYAENPVNGNLSVYAKYESIGDAEALTLDSFARIDQRPNVSFRFKALDDAAGSPEAARAAVTLAVKDGTDPVEIAVTGNGDGTYTVYAPDGFNPGCSYELNLAGGWTFLPDGSGTIESDAIRTAAFSIEMDEVEDLRMNTGSDGIRYIQDTDQISYTYTDSGRQSHTVAELPSNADITNGGRFEYDGASGLQPDDILCIYVGAQPDDGDDSTKTEEAVYAKVQSVSGNTVSFEPLETEDQMRLYDIPDNFPIKVDALPAGDGNTVKIDQLDAALYAQMVGAEKGTLDNAKAALGVGDFVSLYEVDSSEIYSLEDVRFGRVTDVRELDGATTIYFEQCTAQDIRDSANLYKSVDVENTDYITAEEAAEIQRIVQAQVEQSDFAEEAAYLLADMSTRTNGFRESMGVLDFTAAGEDGEAVSEAQLVSYAGLMELDGGDDGVEVKVAVILDKDKLHFGNKGFQLAVQVDAKFKVDAEDGAVHFDLSATFVQEVAVDPRVKGELVYKEILFIPVPTGVQVNAIVDVKSYTAMSLRADIYTVAEEDKPIWEQFKDFTKDPSALADIPGLPAGLTDGLKTVGDAIDKIEDTKAKIDKGLEDANKLQSDLEALWSVVEASAKNGLTRETYENACEALGKTNIAGELMEMLHLTQDEITPDYINGLDDLMDRYSELLEKETDWVKLVNANMFSYSTPPEFGVIVGVQTSFVVRADINITLGTNLEYEVGKRYNFWFRVGLFKPTSGSSTMDLIDEHFAFQFYVMGKLGLKTGVRLKLYAAIGSVDAISVGITTELGPYVKLWGFFIYDYNKYRPANTQNWVYKEQMAGALYLEFGLYLMVGVEAKALFLEYDKDFVDEEFPLLDAGDRYYYYDTAYEPLDESDEIVVYQNGTAGVQPGCAVSMLLPAETYALKYIDLTTGRQGTRSLDFDNYTFKVSNPSFRVDNVGGRPVISVISIPQNVRLMQCDLTITYRHGKLAFSTFDMSTTVHLAWTNMTAAEYQQVYTASVTVPDGNGGQEVIWSRRVRKGTPFDLPAEKEIKSLLSWSEDKYAAGSGYGSQQTEGVTLIENTQYPYHLGYQTYQITVSGIEGGTGSRTFTGKYGEPFDFSSLAGTGTNGPSQYTRFAGLMMDGEPLSLNQPINGRFAASKNAAATAQYADETVTAAFEFTGMDHEPIEVKLRRGGTPDTRAVEAAVPEDAIITGFYPEVGPMDGDMAYQVVCRKTGETPPDVPNPPETKKVTITFVTNGGPEVAAQTRTTGAVLGTLPIPTRTGYGFDGWYSDAELTTPVNANTVVTGAMTLYARWTQGSVTVTFNSNGGVNLDPNTKTVAYGEAYGELPTPEWSGHSFQGWFTAADETGTQVTSETAVDTTEAHTLYAHWGELKNIPDTVFDFGARETFTYDKSSRTAEYTFEPGDLAGLTADSFTIHYTRLSDEFRAENTDEGEAPVTAGSYIAHITREADGTYAKFDKTYGNTMTDAVLVINRTTRDLSGFTNEDIVLGEDYGRYYRKVSLKDGAVDDLDQEAYVTYTITEVNEQTHFTKTYRYDNKAVESGLLYDLPAYDPDDPYNNWLVNITAISVIDDINYEDASKTDLEAAVSRKPENPTRCISDWESFANKDWYNETDTAFEIGTVEELIGLSLLVRERKDNFAGKTVTLTADIDLSDYQNWLRIGSNEGSSSNGTGDVYGFAGTFDGAGHKIISCPDYLFNALGRGTGVNSEKLTAAQFYDCQVVIKNLTMDDCSMGFVNNNVTSNASSSCYTKFINCTSHTYVISGMTAAARWIFTDYGSSEPRIEKFENCTARPLRTGVN